MTTPTTIVQQFGGTSVSTPERRQHVVARDAVSNDETTTLGLQGLLQFGHASMDELDPAVGRIGQRIENLAVENKGAHHLPGAFEGMVERGMIVVAEITAKPDQRADVFSHGVCGPL